MASDRFKKITTPSVPYWMRLACLRVCVCVYVLALLWPRVQRQAGWAVVVPILFMTSWMAGWMCLRFGFGFSQFSQAWFLHSLVIGCVRGAIFIILNVLFREESIFA